jgi:hypothetical protein
MFLKIWVEKAELFFENFNKVKNDLIYAKITQVLQYMLF